MTNVWCAQSDEFLERIWYGIAHLQRPILEGIYIYIFPDCLSFFGGTECFPFNYLTVFVCFYAINNNNIYIIYINYIYNVCTMVDMYCIPLPLLHTCRART